MSNSQPRNSDASAAPVRVRIAFVCLGNICRSPLAEALLRVHATREGIADRIEVRSMGTGDWHVGQGADRRTVADAAARGLDLSAHRAAQFSEGHLAESDHVFVMDRSNLHDVLALDVADVHGFKVRLTREFDPEPSDAGAGEFAVPDPYTGGPEAFARVHTILDRTTARIAHELKRQYGW